MVTIVLVYGAFADGSSWNRVIKLLLNMGYRVVAPSNPLRGVEHDSAYVTSVVGPPSWRSVKSWAVIATSDKAAGTDIVREMAQRAGAKITEVDSSHVVMVSHPEVVTDVILDAARASELAAASR